MSGSRVVETVLVMLCCNDPDNGNPLGWLDSLECDGCVLESPCWDRGPVLRRGPAFGATRRVKIGRYWYPIYGYDMWVGNWCWDAVWMSVDDARSLVTRLLAWGFSAENWTEGCRLLDALPSRPTPGGPET